MKFSPLLLLCLSTSLAAQDWNTGPLPGLGAVYFVKSGSLDSGGNVIDHRRVFTKKPGYGAGMELPPTGAGRPDFRFASLFNDPGQTDGRALVEIDAFSIGQDLIWANPANPDGRISFPTGDWQSVMFSVDQDTSGAGLVVAQEQAKPEGAGADIFGYITRASNLSARYQEMTTRAVDSTQMDLAPATPATEIAAVDMHAPFYQFDFGFVNRRENQPRVFFSITRSTITTAPANWWFTLAGVPVTPSGAAILTMSWSRMGGWSVPKVFCEPQDLGLTLSDDIDALGVDLSYTGNPWNQVHMVWSTTGTPTTLPSEIMFAAKLPTDMVVVEDYEDEDGTSVEQKGGTGEKVDAVCVLDPFVRSINQVVPPATSTFAWGTPSSTPFAGLPFVDESLWASAFRDCIPGSSPPDPRIEIWMNGWGSRGPQVDNAQCLIAFSNPFTLPSYLTLSLQVRDPLAPNGDPRVAVIDAPSLSTLLGVPLWAFWATAGPGPGGSFGIDISNATRLEF